MCVDNVQKIDIFEKLFKQMNLNCLHINGGCIVPLMFGCEIRCIVSLKSIWNLFSILLWYPISIKLNPNQRRLLSNTQTYGRVVHYCPPPLGWLGLSICMLLLIVVLCLILQSNISKWEWKYLLLETWCYHQNIIRFQTINFII